MNVSEVQVENLLMPKLSGVQKYETGIFVKEINVHLIKILLNILLKVLSITSCISHLSGNL